MRVLVTGGQGFIGRYVIEELRAGGIDPVSFDNHQRQHAGMAVEHVLGWVQDFGSVYEAVGKVDGVIHLAAVLGTQETVRCPEIPVEVNICGSLNVFEACVQHSKPCVYITVGNHWMTNPYSITKTAAERFAHMFNKERGGKIAVVRALNAYGPRQKSKPVRKIMPTLILAALKNTPIEIYGDGEQIMDMIYVKDVARFLVRALLTDPGAHPVFEAGTGRPTSVNQIAELVRREAGSSSEIVHLPMRPGEPANSVVVGDPRTLGPLGWLGWQDPASFISLEAGVRETVAWYRKELQKELHP